MDKEKLLAMIHSSEHENEYWDFKEKWYTKQQKADLVKDVVCFANTTHHQDCYLIIGVTDDQRIVGVEHDENRKNKQNLRDMLSRVPFAKDTPHIDVQTYVLAHHEVDVITIFDSDQVPFFLQGEYRKGKVLYPGAIYCRINDSNTPFDATASDSEVERLWHKRFHQDMEIMDRFTYLLKEEKHWEYVENDEYIGFLYKIDPDFQIVLKDDNAPRQRTAAYAINETKPRITWQRIQFRYRNVLIKEILGVWLDGGRALAPVPNLINWNDEISFYAMFRHSLAYQLLTFIHQIMPLSDCEQIARFKHNIVIYDDEIDLKHQQNLFMQALQKHQLSLRVTTAEISSLKQKMQNDYFNENDREMQPDHLKTMLKQVKTTMYINQL